MPCSASVRPVRLATLNLLNGMSLDDRTVSPDRLALSVRDLAADVVGPLEQDEVGHAGPLQADGRGDPAEAGADDRHARHRVPPGGTSARPNASATASQCCRCGTVRGASGWSA